LIPAETKITVFGLPPFSVLLWFLAFLWGVNGWFQSMGFPPIAKNLSYWFCNKERGIKWSLWSSSHELGTYLSMVLSGYLITHFSWQMVFIVPAAISIIYCYFFYKNLQDKPSTIGLPDIEKYKDPDYVEPVVQKDAEAELTYNDIFTKYILKNPTVWMLAIAYVFVYVVRNGTVDWLAMYQVTEKHLSISSALSKTKYLPLVGVLGTIGAGFVSDKFFNSKRAPVNIICLALLPIILYLFKINVVSGPWNYNVPLDIFFISLMGIFTCAPQVLIGGISAVESSSKKVASAVTGFCGMFGYIGSILSGVGTGYIVDKFSWSAALNFWIISSLIALAICIFLLKGELKKK
ncbi:MAG: MFS transporter, partial [Candidatus Gastranaerophilales bacterium]|nr:MFS transporter [Candidatus Gastranaerophilales bacterium]